MRLAIVGVLALLIFGTLAAYARFLATLPSREVLHYQAPSAEGKFAVEVTLSFAAEKDAFSLDDDPAVVVRMAGSDLLKREGRVESTEPLRAEDVPGIVAGRNAFYVRAVPAEPFISQPCAVRLKIERDGQTIAENTLWSSSGGIVAGELVIDVPASELAAAPEENP
jgi:hypothetical protein